MIDLNKKTEIYIIEDDPTLNHGIKLTLENEHLLYPNSHRIINVRTHKRKAALLRTPQLKIKGEAAPNKRKLKTRFFLMCPFV